MKDDNLVFRRPRRRGVSIADVRKSFPTKKRLGWVSIGLVVLALATASTATGVLAWYLLKEDVFNQEQSVNDVTLGMGDATITKKVTFTPESVDSSLQSSIKDFSNIPTTSQDLTKSDATFTDLFLGQTKMLSKGISNTNDKIEALWEGFIDKYFTKDETGGAYFSDEDGKTNLDSLVGNQNVLPDTLYVNKDFTAIKDVKIKGSLTIDGTLLLSNDVTIGDTTTSGTTANLRVTGETTLDGTSSLLGDVTIGDTTTSGTTANLIVTGTSTLLNNVTIGTTSTQVGLTVNGTVNITSQLQVGTTSVLLGNVTIGDIASSGTPANLRVTGETTLDGTSSLLGNVTIGDTTPLGTTADLIVTGSTNLRSTLSVTSTTDLLGDVTIGDTTGTPANLEVTGTSQFDGTSTFFQNVVIGNTTGTAANLIVTGTTALWSNVTIGRTSPNPNAYLTVNGNMNITGGLTVGTADSTFLGNVTLGSLGSDNQLGGSTTAAADTTTTIKGTLDLSSAAVQGIDNFTFQGQLNPTRTTGKTTKLPSNFGTEGRILVEVEVNGVSKLHSLELSSLSTTATTLEYGYTFSDYFIQQLGTDWAILGVGLWEKIWQVNVTYDSTTRDLIINLDTNPPLIRFKHFTDTSAKSQSQYLASQRVSGLTTATTSGIDTDQNLIDTTTYIGQLAIDMVGSDASSYIKSITIIRANPAP